MAFLVPEPVVRQKRTKVRQNCDKTLNNSSIFDRIRDLCRVPNPIIESIDETLFVSSVFDNIRELCRRPDLLTTIDEEWIEEQKNIKEVVETKVWQKKKKQNYIDSIDNSNRFETLCKSKLFASLVRGRHKSVDNLNVIPSDDSNSQTICENNINECKKVNKRSNVKSCAKSKQNKRKPLKPLLSIDCDISSMITEYSKQQSIPKKRTYNRKKTKICETIQTSNDINSSQESVDSVISLSYESMSSPSVSSCNINSYSMPATPVSSTDSQLSQSSVTSYETISTTSVLSQIRRSLNPKYETYRQYIQRCIQNEAKVKTKSCKRGSKRQNPDFKEKVLEWSKKLCSGNTTPIHNIEYLETPPGSPHITNVLTNDELNAMIDSLENKDFIETNDNLNKEFNSLLSDLYSDFPINFDIF